jgi:hypothetical protein
VICVPANLKVLRSYKIIGGNPIRHLSIFDYAQIDTCHVTQVFRMMPSAQLTHRISRYPM